MIFFGRLSSIFSKYARSFSLRIFDISRIRPGGAIDWRNGANDFAGKQKKLCRRPCMKSRIFENFMKTWSWWAFLASNPMKFLRWREFHCLAAPRYSIIWLVERHACRVIPRRGWICNRLTEMVMIFFGRLSSIFSKCARSFSSRIFDAARIGSGGATERRNWANDFAGKPINCPDPRAWKVGFSKILWNLEAGERFRHQIPWNFFAGANFIALRRRAIQLYDS